MSARRHKSVAKWPAELAMRLAQQPECVKTYMRTSLPPLPFVMALGGGHPALRLQLWASSTLPRRQTGSISKVHPAVALLYWW
jgi:hypothetical protein